MPTLGGISQGIPKYHCVVSTINSHLHSNDPVNSKGKIDFKKGQNYNRCKIHFRNNSVVSDENTR